VGLLGILSACGRPADPCGSQRIHS